LNKTIKCKEFDILYIGHWRDKERYYLVKKINSQCKRDHLTFFYYLYYPWSAHELINAIRKGIIPYEAKHKLLSHHEILDLLAITNTVIDFPSSFQTGLTMRTFETLGAGKKLITSNKNIKNEPFYDPQYVSLFDINNLKFDIDFINHIPTSSIGEKINDYSIKNYLNHLMQ
jgi:hypothetical protein